MSSVSNQQRDRIHREIAELGPWFHNLHLPDGTQTAPDHPLGDFPAFKWQQIGAQVPEDLAGWAVLDIGCNAGYYSFQLAQRGAHVTAIDMDSHYLRQARWAVEYFGLQDRVRFEEMQIYDLAHRQETYDLVWFMGVLYHLRYPLLALDIIRQKVRRLMVLQTLTMWGDEIYEPDADFSLDERHILEEAGWPKMAFIEHRLAGDPTNWWVPNQACVEALIRASGFQVTGRPAHEVYLCAPIDSKPPGVAQSIARELRAAVGQRHT